MGNNIRKIVAIGGGEVELPDGINETRNIDKEIVKLSGKKHPNLLFIPTASTDSASYCAKIKNYFEDDLGCKVSFLLLLSKDNINTAKEKIEAADIIYVGGGNTFKMMKKWRSMGVDRMLLDATDRGAIMSGMSAGAICWFRYGASDSHRFNNPEADMIKVSGLGFINAVLCPHYSAAPHRIEYLNILMAKTSGIALALDDCCAIEIIGDKYRILTSDNKANAYKVFNIKGKIYKVKVEKSKEFTCLNSLLKKQVVSDG